MPDVKLSPCQFQKLEKPFPVQRIKPLACPCHLFKYGYIFNPADLTAAHIYPLISTTTVVTLV